MTERKRKLPFPPKAKIASKAISSWLIHSDSAAREVKSEFLEFEIDSVKIKFPFVP